MTVNQGEEAGGRVSNRDAIARELRDAISALGGIRDARVDIDASGEITVRTLGVPERAAEETVREVISVGRSLGLTIDPSRVQVMRLKTEAPAPQPARRRIGALSTSRYGEEFTARVSLELHGDVLVGESASPLGPRSELRAVALAILEAARELLEFPVTVEAVGMFEVGTIRSILVVLNRGPEVLVGSAIVRVDVYDAVARATLDALNRFIARGPVLEPAS